MNSDAAWRLHPQVSVRPEPFGALLYHFGTCKGGCMAAKFFTGLPLDGPDPECVQGYGEQALAVRKDLNGGIPTPSGDHSHRTSPPRPRTGNGAVRLTLSRREDIAAPPVSACAESPLASFAPAATPDFSAQIEGASERHNAGNGSDST